MPLALVQRRQHQQEPTIQLPLLAVPAAFAVGRAAVPCAADAAAIPCCQGLQEGGALQREVWIQVLVLQQQQSLPKPRAPRQLPAYAALAVHPAMKPSQFQHWRVQELEQTQRSHPACRLMHRTNADQLAQPGAVPRQSLQQARWEGWCPADQAQSIWARN